MHGASLDFVGQVWRDAQSMVHRSVKIGNRHGILDNLAGTLIRSPAIQETLPKPTTKHQNAAGFSKVPVHSIVLRLFDDFRLLDLLLHGFVRLTFDHHVTAELAG